MTMQGSRGGRSPIFFLLVMSSSLGFHQQDRDALEGETPAIVAFYETFSEATSVDSRVVVSSNSKIDASRARLELGGHCEVVNLDGEAWLEAEQLYGPCQFHASLR